MDKLAWPIQAFDAVKPWRCTGRGPHQLSRNLVELRVRALPVSGRPLSSGMLTKPAAQVRGLSVRNGSRPDYPQRDRQRPQSAVYLPLKKRPARAAGLAYMIASYRPRSKNAVPALPPYRLDRRHTQTTSTASHAFPGHTSLS
jgi:hypothetical protein